MKTNRIKIRLFSAVLLGFSFTAMGQVKPSFNKGSAAKSASAMVNPSADMGKKYQGKAFQSLSNLVGVKGLASGDLEVLGNGNASAGVGSESEAAVVPNFDYQVSLLENGTQLHFEILNHPDDVALLTQWSINVKCYDAVPVETTDSNPWTYHAFPSTTADYLIDGGTLSAVIDLPPSAFPNGLCSIDFEIDFVTDNGTDETGLQYYEVGHCMAHVTGIESTIAASATLTETTVDLGVKLDEIAGISYWGVSLFTFNSASGQYQEIEYVDIDASESSAVFPHGISTFTTNRVKYRIRMVAHNGSTFYFPDGEDNHLLEIDAN